MFAGNGRLQEEDVSTPLLPSEYIKQMKSREKVQFRSTLDDENSLDSFADSTFSSEDLDVVETEESIQYVTETTIGKLARIGFKRPLWRSKMSSYFVIISFLMNFEAFITFPAMFRRFGESFTLAYLLLMTFLGLPIVYMELALGQYTSTNVLTVFSRIAPAFSGVGLAMIIFDLLYSLHDQLVLQYITYFFLSAVNAMADQMPWHNCVTSSNKPDCVSYRQYCGENPVSRWIPETGRDEALNENHRHKFSAFGDACIQSGLSVLQMKELDSVSWTSQLATKQEIFPDLNSQTLMLENWPSGMALSYLSATMIGIALISQMSHRTIVTMSQLAVTILISFTIICTLIVFLKPFPFAHLSLDGSFTMSLEVWVAALVHMIRTLKLGQGRLIFIGAQNSFRNSISTDSLVIYMFMAVIPFIYGMFYLITMDSDMMKLAEGDADTWTFLWNMFGSDPLWSHSQHVYLLLFTTSIQLYESYEPFIVCVLSVMILLMTVAGKVVQIEYHTAAFLERFEMFSGQRRMIAFMLSLVGFLLMLPLLSEYAMEVVIDCHRTIFPLVGFGLVLMEVVVVSYVYGGRRLIANISAMTVRDYKDEGWIGLVVDSVTVFIWSFVIPFVMGSFLLISSFTVVSATSAWFLGMLVLACAPGVLIYKVLNAREAHKSISMLFKPVEELWGPRCAADDERAKRVERQIRSMC